MTDNTTYLVDVAEAAVSLLESNKGDLGLKSVWYGDQELYSSFPTVSVEPISAERVLTSTGSGVENHFTLYIYVYHGPLAGVQRAKRDADKLSAEIERVFHQNLQLNKVVIHGYVTRNEPGQAQHGSLLGVTRLIWEGITKTLLGV